MTNNSDPLVSIYIPTKNRFELVTRAIQSCLDQTYPHIEIIVVDDGSIPEVQQQLQQYCQNQPKILLKLNADAGGACRARNQAIAIAHGEFMTGLDDDDEFTPERIAQFVCNWSAADHFLCSGYLFFLPNGQQLRSGRHPQLITACDLLNSNLVGNQIFTKTEYLRAIDGYDPALVACQDYDAWIRLSQRFGSGRRIGNFSYLVHQEHEFERISTVERRLTGHRQLIIKHQLLWSDKQLRSQEFLSQLHSGAPVSLRLLPLAGKQHCRLLMKMWLVALWQKLTKAKF